MAGKPLSLLSVVLQFNYHTTTVILSGAVLQA
jgi:hypothetical protein